MLCSEGPFCCHSQSRWQPGDGSSRTGWGGGVGGNHRVTGNETCEVFFPLPSLQWFHTWITLDKDSLLHCWFFDVDVKQDGDHLQLNLNDLRSSHAGTYRCASLNATGNTSVSEELKLQVECTWHFFLWPLGSSRDVVDNR